MRALPYLLLAGLAVLPLAPGDGFAACDVIPGPQGEFRGTVGTVDRPFATPGDLVEVTLDAAAIGGVDDVVSVVFRPRDGGPVNVAIVAADCTGIAAQWLACDNVGAAKCVPANASADAVDLDVVDARHLRFRFPDTDDQIGAATDDLTWSGPAAIAVTGRDGAAVCPLARNPCAASPGVKACVDSLFVRSFSNVLSPDETFRHFTALPPSNDYQALCVDPSPPCTGLVNDIRFALDIDGNILLPVDWRGVLINSHAVPVARLVTGTASVEAFPGTGLPIRFPGRAFVGSFSPRGGALAPVFDPQVAPPEDNAGPHDLTLFGSVDATQTVLVLLRRSPVFKSCTGGANDRLPCTAGADCPDGTCDPAACQGGGNEGSPCTADAQCPGGECGSSLFDFRSRLVTATGPAVLRVHSCLGGTNAFRRCTGDRQCPGGQCGDFRLSTADPVTLDGFAQTDSLNAFVIDEAIEDRDLNGDGDQLDDVVVLGDRLTGEPRPIGLSRSTGRAVLRIHQPPFSFPALAVENDVLAFVESEIGQGGTDANGNQAVVDGILRVFRLHGGELTEALVPPRAVDAAPMIDGKSIAISNHRVFYRRSEAGSARKLTTQVGVPPSRSPAMSADASVIAFLSDATGLAAPESDTTGVFAVERSSNEFVRVDVGADGAPADGDAFAPGAVSADGLAVAFSSGARNLVTPADHFCADALCSDVFIHDRQTGATERVTTMRGPVPQAYSSVGPALSADGRFVAFSSSATALDVTSHANDLDGTEQVFVRDRCVSHGVPVPGCAVRTEVASIGTANVIADGHSGLIAPVIAADGTIVGYTSQAANLVPNDSNRSADVFVRDRISQTTERISVDSRGGEGNSASGHPSMSGDGRFVAFQSDASNLVAGDTNSATDVFVFDRTTRLTERVSVGNDDIQSDGVSAAPVISADGRFVAFESAATNLIERDTNGIEDVFVRDRVAGTTERVSTSSAGRSANGDSGLAAISADGRHVAFNSTAQNLVTPQARARRKNVYVREPDPADAASDIFADGEVRDNVVEVLATDSGATTVLCPATQVAVAHGRVAFLRPESTFGTATCPAGSLNSDGDVADLVVQLWDGGGAPRNLGLAATTVALSADAIAATASEVGEQRDDGSDGDLNGDGDDDDHILHVRRIAGDAWTNTGQAADQVVIFGSVVAFLTPEAQQGGDLNGDGDEDDRIVQVYLVEAGTVIDTGQSAEELVVGGYPGNEIVAFRTVRATGISALQIYDLSRPECRAAGHPASCVIDTGSSVTPCFLEACDPRVPYKVRRDTVSFLTLEGEQVVDLNGDGDTDDIILQVFNVRVASQLARQTASAGEASTRTTAPSRAPPRQAIGAVSRGICTNSGDACATDRACAGGICFVPPGGCIRTLTLAPCVPETPASCGPGNFCEPVLGAPGQGVCKQVVGICSSQKDCATGDVCRSADQRIQRLAGPLTTGGASGQLFTGAGRCVEKRGTTCTQPTDCRTGEFCAEGVCQRDQGVCRSDASCLGDAVCKRELLTVAPADSDGDEILDQIDNCPTVPNVLQRDDDCAALLCGGGAVIGEARLSLERLDANPGRQKLAFSGTIACLGNVGCTNVDPLANGAQLRLSDAGAALFDLTTATHVIPAGEAGSGCDPLRDGWKKSASGTYVYTNTSGAIDPPLCTPGSAEGLRQLRVKVDHKRGIIRFRALVDGATMLQPTGAIAGTIVFRADTTAGSPGTCATVSFPTVDCRVRSHGAGMVCRGG